MNYDVFLCYNREEKDYITEVAEALKRMQLLVWYDDRSLTGRQTLTRELVRGINESRSVAVFVGRHGIGSWQKLEIEKAIEQHTSSDTSIILALLPGLETLPELSPFLENFPRVESKSKTSEQFIDDLIQSITGERPKKILPLLRDKFELRLTRNDEAERYISVYTLPNLSNELIEIDWEAFGVGVKMLRNQMLAYDRPWQINACFGINDAGLTMATFLNFSVFGRRELGYIKFIGRVDGSDLSEDDCYFPSLAQDSPSIMLVDFELKSGVNLETTVDKLRSRYSNPMIYLAVFGALVGDGNKLKIQGFDELKAARSVDGLEIKGCFIACTMHKPGIDPPLKLR